jgi:CrcB protein
MSGIAKLIMLALAGAAGTISRYAVSGFVQRLNGTDFPWGTYAVNAAGCLLFGIIWALYEGKMISPEARVIILVGFMGAFTTFSSFAFETSQFFRDGQLTYAALNILVQNLSGLALFFAGLFMGKSIS